jgi:predicted transposase YbfD/YdcC
VAARVFELPNGIPSHDTIARLFAALDSAAFQHCFGEWVKAVAQLSSGEQIAIDGKTLRHSYDRGGSKGAIHMVSAWANEQRLVLAQVKVDEKSNEITAIPELLKALDLQGCLVTIDAMGTQTAIAQQIIEGGGDYILSLKGNQGNLHEDVEQVFSWDASGKRAQRWGSAGSTEAFPAIPSIFMLIEGICQLLGRWPKGHIH